MGRRAGAKRAGRVLAGRKRGAFLPTGAAREAARTPRRRQRRRRFPNMAALADVTGGCGTAGAGQARRAPEAVGGDRRTTTVCRPSGVRRIAPFPWCSFATRPADPLPPPVSPFLPPRNPGWSHESGKPWPSERGLQSTPAVPLAPQTPPSSQLAFAGVAGPRLGVWGPHETQKGLCSLLLERGADGRALCPHSLALRMEQLHLNGLKVDFVFSWCITV